MQSQNCTRFFALQKFFTSHKIDKTGLQCNFHKKSLFPCILQGEVTERAEFRNLRWWSCEGQKVPQGPKSLKVQTNEKVPRKQRKSNEEATEKVRRRLTRSNEKATKCHFSPVVTFRLLFRYLGSTARVTFSLLFRYWGFVLCGTLLLLTMVEVQIG